MVAYHRRDDDELKQLPCSALHVFHTACIQTWLGTQSTCPLCRTECGERQPPAADAGRGAT